jgi:hypothetical protein
MARLAVRKDEGSSNDPLYFVKDRSMNAESSNDRLWNMRPREALRASALR